MCALARKSERPRHVDSIRLSIRWSVHKLHGVAFGRNVKVLGKGAGGMQGKKKIMFVRETIKFAIAISERAWKLRTWFHHHSTVSSPYGKIYSCIVESVCAHTFSSSLASSSSLVYCDIPGNVCARCLYLTGGGTCLHLIMFYDERENPLSSRINGRNVPT